METTIHIGARICQKLKEEGRTKKWLAEQVCCEPSSLCKSLKSNYFNTDLLMKISLAMKFDFFACLSAHYHSQKHKNK